jgi:hypothetical protein
LPAIFRGIGLNPLTTSNTSYLLWMLMGYLVVTAVLVVSFGSIGDMVGVAGTLWAYLKLEEVAKGEGGRLDLAGNILFGAGLIAVLVGITYALRPYDGATMGWGNPLVLGPLIGGVALLAAFVAAEPADPR